jgi:hypothetical protein
MSARTELDAERPARRRQPRWGVRTILLVGLATVCIVVSSGLGPDGEPWTTVAGLAAWCAIGGAAYCSYRGLRGASRLFR